MKKQQVALTLSLFLCTTPSYTVVPYFPLSLTQFMPSCHDIMAGSGKVLHACGTAMYGLLPSPAEVIKQSAVLSLGSSLSYLGYRMIKKYGPRTRLELLSEELEIERVQGLLEILQQQKYLSRKEAELNQLKLNMNTLQEARLKKETAENLLDLSQNLLNASPNTSRKTVHELS